MLRSVAKFVFDVQGELELAAEPTAQILTKKLCQIGGVVVNQLGL
jgi:hypothetical protein